MVLRIHLQTIQDHSVFIPVLRASIPFGVETRWKKNKKIEN